MVESMLRPKDLHEKVNGLMEILRDHHAKAKDKFHKAEKELELARKNWKEAYLEWNMVEQRMNALFDYKKLVIGMEEGGTS